MENSSTYILLKDALKSLNIKERALQTRCKKLAFERTKEGYKIPIDVFNQWSAKQTAKRRLQPQRN